MKILESFPVPETSQPSTKQDKPANETSNILSTEKSEGGIRSMIDDILHKYGYPTKEEVVKLSKAAQSGFTRIELDRLFGQNNPDPHPGA
jgi:hypothetical protein